jgi:hypothetical protein
MPKKDQEKIAAFFEELLLEHGGAYTLFGSKPVTIEALIDVSAESIQAMQKYLAEHPEIETLSVERRLEEGWEAWRQLTHRPVFKNYILTEVPFEEYRMLILVNVQRSIVVMNKYLGQFRRIAGEEFQPNQAIQELQEGKMDLWKRILLDHQCKGILLGYGAANARLFEEQSADFFEPSEHNDPRMKPECTLNDKPFRIPIFVMFDKEESESLIRQYKNERETIKTYYLGKNFLDATLAQLQQSSLGYTLHAWSDEGVK